MVPKTAIYEGDISQKCRTFQQGMKVDIVGVTGSIPVTPTIQFKEKGFREIENPFRVSDQ
jgi:hypothetical protein